ncbi:hypothetical protein [Longimicrobium sp.]|uniref:hypothetical protein n=1 Tax=Longimicrobium sp. TaxID=2029185 RepID=UPI002E30F3B3|nr:hypothetical protein [Longimicrobium sp.]HEX6037046.1 hypothetical protein [Longimicrobium sp.]
MAIQIGRGGPPDPVRDHLAEVRRALMRLHKTLIDSERPRFEQRRGESVSNTQLLSALLEDAFFQWMRPFSQLMVAMDEALFGDEPVTLEGARGFVQQVHALVEQGEDLPPDEQPPYERARNRDPAVLFAHTELTRRVAAALLAYGDAAA